VTQYRFALCAVFLVAVAAAGCGEPSTGDYTPRPPGELTYRKDIAPVIREQCAACHHAGESAPLELVTYGDVKDQAAQVVSAVEDGSMPPWLPERGYGEFSGARGLSADEIGMIKQWADEGASEGEGADLPPLPERSTTWTLGEPDLVVEVPDVYSITPETGAVYRNLAVRIPLETGRWVRAVELRPTNREVASHAVAMMDRMSSRRGAGRERDFDGMAALSEAYSPDGLFIGWTPGRPRFPEYEDASWWLAPGSDLVLQLHLQSSDEPEAAGAAVGFYFADERPARVPVLLRLGASTIDIPAGVADYTIRDSYVLPVAVEALSIYAHAHYLARRVRAWAVLPNDSIRWLLRIDEWDFNWQDEYRYAEPVTLPQGTTLQIEFVYDNSADNPNNPNDPPAPVGYGPDLAAEMGDLWIQVLPLDRSDRTSLRRDFAAKDSRLQVARYERELQSDSRNAAIQHALGKAYLVLGQVDEAIFQYRRALQIDDDFAEARYSLAQILEATGETQAAIFQYRRVLEDRPNWADVWTSLGNALRAEGDTDEAIEHYERALEVEPTNTGALYSLGSTLRGRGRIQEALRLFGEAVRADAEFAEAHYSLANVLQSQRQTEAAIAEYREALEIDPDFTAAHVNLGNSLRSQGELGEAITHYYQAVASSPADAMARYMLGYTLTVVGEDAEAILHLSEAMRLQPEWAMATTALAWTLATSTDDRVYKPAQARELAESAVMLTEYAHPLPLDALAAANAAIGNFRRAIRHAESAVDIATRSGQVQLAAEIRARLELYRQGQPYLREKQQ
jgi:tetratricopeptide (TPR) repeat protein